MPGADADLLDSFLTPMLTLQHEKRAKAGPLASHPWLEGILVEGEIEQELAKLERESTASGGTDAPPGGSEGTGASSVMPLSTEDGSRPSASSALSSTSSFARSGPSITTSHNGERLSPSPQTVPLPRPTLTT